MARKLDAFPTATTQLYPWDEWLNGDVWQLYKGEDFRSRTTTILANARAQARKRGGSVRSRSVREGDRESLVIQFRR